MDKYTNKNIIKTLKGPKILSESFLNKIFEITDKYKLYNTIKIIQLYNQSIKEEYKDFKQKLSSIESINVNKSKKLYKRYAKKELLEVGIFFLSKNKNKQQKIEISKIILKEISNEIKLERKIMKNNYKICPFCSKSLIYTNRHFFGVRKSSKGCDDFYENLLSLNSINEQLYLYFQTFKYLYDTLENLEYSQFQKIIKKNIKNNTIEYKLLEIRSIAIKFSKQLHKLFDSFKVLCNRNKKKKNCKIDMFNGKEDNIKIKINENNILGNEYISENLEKQNKMFFNNFQMNQKDSEKLNDIIIKNNNDSLKSNFIINQIQSE